MQKVYGTRDLLAGHGPVPVPGRMARCELSTTTPLPVEELTIIKPATKSTSRTEIESTVPSPAIFTTVTATTSATPTTVSTSTSAATTPISIFLTTRTAPTTTTRLISTPLIRINTTSTTSVASVSTTKSATDINIVPTSTTETTSQTPRMSTVGVKEVNPLSFPTKILSLSNVTMTKPWTFSTFKSIATTLPVSSTTTTELVPLKTKERVLTTVPTTVDAVTTDVPQTELVKPVETTTTTLKTPKDNLITDPAFKEATKKPEITIKMYPTTIKFKPKEIWIKPAQKGELSIETKVKLNSEQPKLKSATKKDITTNTTPRTIIVSIIPTSISYATFKKMALTTSSYVSHKTITVKPSTEAVTRSMSPSNPSVKKPLSTSSTVTFFQNATVLRPHTPFTNKTKSFTNSMSTNASISNSSNLTTISSTNSTLESRIHTTLSTKTFITLTSKPATKTADNKTENKQFVAVNRNHTTTETIKVTESHRVIGKTNDTKNVTTVRPSTNVTEDPDGEETFHILTEPEHITAVMGEKGTDRSSVDLISVISIAGGVMMTVITVAVVIVMLERCKRPRFEDGKMNNIRMQVMIDNSDGPPPYVRSIFNTPLPEPPNTEKCHYQPISTLDRNLKQFMRPVVVQTISPMMLENFRGILECHYDHLPRRSIEFQTLQRRRSIAPSMGGFDEPRQQRPDSLAESTIEALKCEAKLDVIDNTTSEPLYAEIPCWRPPSEHAVEIVNLNGEAVTEL
ncbi:uncharacterized protein isoform X2 [Choristoneura fumiferana]|uniref:uncharacterized protein isoform X2 n=1 Tax=Choristoneura fumiferana TaxID=7141 RepID=UPI003D15D60C